MIPRTGFPTQLIRFATHLKHFRNLKNQSIFLLKSEGLHCILQCREFKSRIISEYFGILYSEIIRKLNYRNFWV